MYEYNCSKTYKTKSGEEKTSHYVNKIVKDIKFERTGNKKRKQPIIREIVDIRKKLCELKEFEWEEKEQVEQKLNQIKEILAH